MGNYDYLEKNRENVQHCTYCGRENGKMVTLPKDNLLYKENLVIINKFVELVHECRRNQRIKFIA